MDRQCPICKKAMADKMSTLIHIIYEHIDNPVVIVHLKKVRDGD
jgi:hypothetical protein